LKTQIQEENGQKKHQQRNAAATKGGFQGLELGPLDTRATLSDHSSTAHRTEQGKKRQAPRAAEKIHNNKTSEAWGTALA
jgi:hypothetical protein